MMDKKNKSFHYLEGSDYDRASSLINQGITEIEYECPFCGNDNVTLWLTFYDGSIRVPNTLKCGECGSRFHYEIPEVS